jgi:hypothetical protein
MPYAQINGNDQLASADVKGRTTKVLLTIKTAATAGSVSITSDNPGVQPFWVASGSSGLDAEANFPSLTNTANSVIGLQINDGNLKGYRFGTVDIDAQQTPSMTAIKITPNGSSSTGATKTLKNGAVSLTLTGLTLVATATTQGLGLALEFYTF